MNGFRCKNCRNLQFKYRVIGAKVEIEVKCHSCNEFNKFIVWLPQLIKENEKNKKHEQK